MSEHLVDAPWLAQHLSDVIVADVRWYLDPPGSAPPTGTHSRGRQAYLAGHIPGAQFVDLDTELAAPPGPTRPGRHPLISAAAFAAVLSRLGVTRDATVVAYDDRAGAIAARLWWLLRYFGLRNGRVLDGGIAAWTQAGGVLETGPVTVTPSPPLQLAATPAMVIDADGAAAYARDHVLLDARAGERYRGETEPVDPRAGHIPGAKSAPLSDNLTSEGTFAPVPELERRYQQLSGNRPVAVYCGSGVTACHNLLALALTGRDGKLYEGSWSDWASDPERPAATGNTRG